MILKFDEYFIHVLDFVQRNGATASAEIISKVLELTGTTPDERLLKSPKGTNISNSRVHWAIQFLFQAGALSRPNRGIYEITPLGEKLLKENPAGISLDALRETEGYKNWELRTSQGKKSETEKLSYSSVGEAPQESIESSIIEIEENLGVELVSRIQEMPPEFLEKSVLHLLGAMGYGIDDDSLQHTGGPGDEGIDGIINQDRLGVQRIYVQAKRYKDGNNVGRETVQSFIGALAGASGGVFITTSNFTDAALEFASRHLSPKIVLINGIELGKLLVKYEVGVVVKQTYKLVEIDENYFIE